ncbi:MAG: hypothetical protein FJ144_10500 [Deltaproteobacteria bacterium]|nr:hypothetical protein [Deltaproteobacteria bacterium]
MTSTTVHTLRARSASGATAATLAAVAGFAATLYLYYPGFMTWDSTFQFAQVVSGQVENSHPPLMVYVWMLANAVVYGPGGMLILQAAAYWTGLALIAAALGRSAAIAAALVLLLGFFPPLFATIAMIWKDTGCLAFLLLATGLALQARMSAAPRSRATLVVCGLAATFYASALRSPNLPSALPLLWLLCGALPALSRPASKRLAAVAVIAVVFAGGIFLLDNVGVKRLPYRAAVPLWDLARISIARNELLLPPYAIHDPSLDLPRLREISRDFRCDVYDPADGKKPTTDVSFRTLSEADADRLMRDWASAIAAHPGAYLEHRGHVTSLLFTDPMMKVWHAMESIDGFTLDIAFEPRPPYRQVRKALLWASMHGFFTPWIYVVLATGVLAASYRVRTATASEARAVALSALLYVAPLPVIAPSTDFRYTIWLVAGSLVSLVLLAAGLGNAIQPSASAAWAAIATSARAALAVLRRSTGKSGSSSRTAPSSRGSTACRARRSAAGRRPSTRPSRSRDVR